MVNQSSSWNRAPADVPELLGDGSLPCHSTESRPCDAVNLADAMQPTSLILMVEPATKVCGAIPISPSYLGAM